MGAPLQTVGSGEAKAGFCLLSTLFGMHEIKVGERKSALGGKTKKLGERIFKLAERKPTRIGEKKKREKWGETLCCLTRAFFLENDVFCFHCFHKNDDNQLEMSKKDSENKIPFLESDENKTVETK